MGIVSCSFLLVVASCEPQELDNTGDSSVEILPGFAPITATAPATADGSAILWEVRDTIALRSQDSPQQLPVASHFVTVNPSPKATAVFKKSASDTNIPTKLDGKYVAVYPPSANYVEWGVESYVTFAPKADQRVRNRSVDRASATLIAVGDESELNFRHVASYVKFAVTPSSSAFSKVTVTSREESQILVSRIRVNLDGEFSYSLQTHDQQGSAYEQTSDRVSFSTADGTSFPHGSFLIAVNPGTYAKGLTVNFENESGQIVTKEYDQSYTVRPGEVIDLGQVGNLGFPGSLPISIYEKAGKKLGVVFYQDPKNTSKRKVVSAEGKLTKWASSNNKWRINTFKTDYDYVHTVVTTSDAYIANPEDFPAVHFCDQMRKDYGGNWHVPSVDEMNLLFNGYYGKPSDTAVEKNLEYYDSASKAAAAYFDYLLESMDADAMFDLSDQYWICGQNSDGNMQYVNMKKYRHDSDNQTTEKYVRCVCDVDDNVPEGTTVYPQTGVGKLLKGAHTAEKITDVTWDMTFNVTNGLDYYKLKVVTDSTERVKKQADLYLVRADMSKGFELKVAISDQTKESSGEVIWQKQELTKMAKTMNTDSKPLYCMVNADFCEEELFKPLIYPRGPVHCNRTIMNDRFYLKENLNEQGLNYIGVTNDGKITIGPRDDYETVKNTLKECTGAGVMLVKDSEKVGGYTKKLDPRTAIGYTASGIVWVLVVDGRHSSAGMTYDQMANIFYALGCEMAVNLDGGGSTEMLLRDPGTDKIDIVNWPSDPDPSHGGTGGVERPRLNAWAIVKK